jgi:hypothetical protein
MKEYPMKPTDLELFKKYFPEDAVFKPDKKREIYLRITEEKDMEVVIYYLVLYRTDRKRADFNTISYNELKKIADMKEVAQRHNCVSYKIAFRVGNKFIFQFI